MQLTNKAELERRKDTLWLEINERDQKVLTLYLQKDINGLSDEDVANATSISRRTLHNIKSKHSEYIEVVEQLKALELPQVVITNTEDIEEAAAAPADIDLREEIMTVLNLVVGRAKKGNIKDIEILLKYYSMFNAVIADINKANTQDIESLLQCINEL